MALTGTLGATLWISTTPMSINTDSEVEYWAVGYWEIGLIENFGEFGKMFDLVTFQAVLDGRTYKLKGGYNGGTLSVVVGTDLEDNGQSDLADAADDATQQRYAFRIILNDNTTDYGAGSIYYFLGLPMSFRSNLASVNSVFRATANIEVDGEILYYPPGQLLEFYAAGDSLAHWVMFNGTDAQAMDPVISGGNLYFETGNAGTGFAADGSQAISNTTDLLLRPNDFADIFFIVRFRITTSIIAAAFIGLTDQNAALEIPLEMPAGSLVSNASNAVGFLFDHGNGGGSNWRLVGVRADVDKTVQDTGIPMVVDQVYTLEAVINGVDADTTFYIDGVQVGTTMTGATSPGTNHRPTFAVTSRNTTTTTAEVSRTYIRARV